MSDSVQDLDPAQRYRRLIEIVRDLTLTQDLDPLLDRIVSIAVELSGCEASSILLFDETSQQLFFEAASNINDQPLMRGMSVPLEGSLAGWVLRNRQPVIAADVPHDRRHFTQVDKATHLSTTSLMGIPMVARDTVIGVLEVINKRQGGFTQEDQDILTILSSQAAIAIYNTRLHHQADLISELVHELRTPLSSLNAIAHLLQKPAIEDDLRFKMASLIQGETRRLNEMATEFLDISRLESGRAAFHLSSFEVPSLLYECCDLVKNAAQDAQLEMRTAIESHLPELQGDRDKLKQVLLNLLSNAIKYNQPGGKVTVSAGTKGGWMALGVADTGIGIAPEDKPHLFEKFFRGCNSETIAGGTGLGLSICKQIVDSHRGQIKVKSQLKRGTTFTILLPVKQI
jgi:signal transduction histidine kinase